MLTSHLARLGLICPACRAPGRSGAPLHVRLALHTESSRAYDLAGASPGTPPFAAVGYDLDLDTLTPSASFYATRGTLTFTRICAGGFQGTLTGAHFVAVAGLMNPTLVPNGCAFDVPMITFAYGATCPAPG